MVYVPVRPVFCASSAYAQQLSEEDYWWAVFNDGKTPEEVEAEVIEELIAEAQRETWVIECARCGRTVEVEEETRVDRERDAFCDECADEAVEVPDNEPWDMVNL